MALTFDDTCQEAVDNLFDDKKLECDFVVLEILKDSAVIVDQGKGGRQAVEDILKEADDKVMAGCFMCTAVDNREVTVSTRRKYVQFIWQGGKVGVMAKGRLNSQSGAIKNLFNKSHLELQISDDLDDISEKAIEKALLSAGGAHAPNSFDFTNDILAEGSG
mmetsp:Transcript_55897/g.122288  ORF Transcript_55897/g.122288 Transcript_55897/m.122288 type:complete len:162 (+) Transcript_55897:98-583(+)